MSRVPLNAASIEQPNTVTCVRQGPFNDCTAFSASYHLSELYAAASIISGFTDTFPTAPLSSMVMAVCTGTML